MSRSYVGPMPVNETEAMKRLEGLRDYARKCEQALIQAQANVVDAVPDDERQRKEESDRNRSARQQFFTSVELVSI